MPTTTGLEWNTDSTGPARFVSVHGRRAAIFGYSQDGLEIWTYPFQIIRSMSASFRPQGATTPIDGQVLLRRILYSPEAVTRIYAGPDFIVREKLFVPLDEEGAIISYEVESTEPIDIMIRFIPVLDLMWPASIGGQEAVWNSTASAYRLSEAAHRFTASVGSPDIVAHDETPNSNRSVGIAPGLAFTLRAGGAHKSARFAVAGAGPGQDARLIANKLLEQSVTLEKDAVDHYSDLLSHVLQIETPDADTNRALAWSEVALDQAWVCDSDLGCGLVAGYGPSRKARRPQYDWFFAGDGMVATRALLAAGEYQHARQELEFILKYQDQKTGMIWHELSQSAGWLDWAKYPYMFLHIDLTFDFLNTLAEYLSVTGDHDFVSSHWMAIQSAHEYCRSLLDPNDGLPRIPSGHRGQREQDELSDELTLSASWATASQAFANLAAATGHNQAADEARTASQRAVHTVNQRYWDEGHSFWISGYTRSGTPLIDRNLGPAGALETPLFTPAQRNSLLDQLASSDFQADWGTRGRASNASNYAPNSYASGSVWATGTAGVAQAFWAEHRPVTALPIWSALVPWSSLDSLGHMHEALAGDYYHEEIESVPEQTWSSATFFTAAVNGLLGLQVNGVSREVTFVPHLPPEWNAITVRNLQVGSSLISFHMMQSAGEVRLQMKNEGAPVDILFDPALPLGAKLRAANLDGRTIPATLESHEQDTHAKVKFILRRGDTSLTLAYQGGVAIVSESPRLSIGEPSKATKITGVRLSGRILTVDFDFLPSASTGFELRTPWAIQEVQGATFETVSPALYRIHLAAAPAAQRALGAYQHGQLTLTFASID